MIIDDRANQWAEMLEAWEIPASVLRSAPESPWFYDTDRFSVGSAVELVVPDQLPHRLPIEVLPPEGGTVLDVGCGGGRSSLPLARWVQRIIGVDINPDLLAAFSRGARAARIEHQAILGQWPDAAPDTPPADVVICHHVAYNVADLAPFLEALTEHARLAVVLVIPERHPMSAWDSGWKHFWGLDRPDGPTAHHLVEIARLLGYAPEVHRYTRPDLTPWESTPDQIRSARRRLCLPAHRDEEVGDYFRSSPPAFVERYVALRWPGAANDS